MEISPYKFLDFYELEDRDIFFGREREIEILLSEVIVNRLVVLFAKTGTGKTSLINAGVRPELEDLKYKTLFIRVEENPIESTRSALRTAELLPPELEEKPLDTQLEEAYKKAEKPIVLFYDQFEEFFIQITRIEDRKPFISAIANVYNKQKLGIHIVFSMREEFFHEMDDFRDEIPNIFHKDSNLRLREFDESQARDAIVEPAKKFGVEIEENLVKELLKDLKKNETIEPARLQIICDTIWKQKEKNQTKIKLANYLKYKQNGKNPSERIYDSRLKDDIEQNLDDNQIDLLNKLIPELCTKCKTKYPRGFEELIENLKIDYDVFVGLVNKLKHLRLIRENTRNELRFIEWTSDYLAICSEDLNKNVRAILLRRKLELAVKRAKNRIAELTRSSDLMNTPFIVPDSEEDLVVLYMDRDDFKQNFDEVAVLLLGDIDKEEAEFLFTASLEHGIYINKWFQKALDCKGNVWKLIKDRLEYGNAQNIQVENSIQLLIDLKHDQAMELLKDALKKENLASLIINTLRRKATKQTIDILAVIVQQEGSFALRAGMALNSIANSGLGKPTSLAKDALSNLSKKKTKSLLLLALDNGIDMHFWFDKALEKGVEAWGILENKINKVDQNNGTENSIHLLGELETIEAVNIWESLLEKERFTIQALSALERIFKSNTSKKDAKDKTRSILNKVDKKSKKSKTKFRLAPSDVEKRRNEKCGTSEETWSLLLERIKEDKCTPFIGHRASSPFLPLNEQISQELAIEYNYPSYDIYNLPSVTQFLATQKDRTFTKFLVVDFLKKKREPVSIHHDSPHAFLAGLPFSIYLTTSYDDFMLQALENKRKNPIFEYCRWNKYISKLPCEIEEKFQPSLESPLVYYLHGFWDIPESLVITEDDYLNFLVNVSENRESILHHRVRRSLFGNSLLFIGYNIEDYSFRTIIRGLIGSPEKTLRRTNITIQLTPQELCRQSILTIIKSMEKYIGLNMNSEQSEETNITISNIKNVATYSYLNKKDKVLIYKQICDLEMQLIKISPQIKFKEYPIKMINLLQESIGQFPTEDEAEKNSEAIRYLEKYYNEMDICVYWGTPVAFAKELKTRWENFKRE